MTGGKETGKYLRLVRFLRNLKPEVGGKVLIGLLITAAGFLQAVMIAGAIGILFEKEPFNRLLPYLAGTFAAILLRAFLLRYQEGYSKKMAAKVKGAIRNTLLDQLMQLGPAYQNDKRSGNMQSLITDGVESLEMFLVNYIPQTAVVLVSVTAVVSYICFLDLPVGLIILGAAVFSIAIPHLFMSKVNCVMIEYWQDYAHLNARYIEAMQGMATLKAFHASKNTLKQLKTDADQFAGLSIKNTGISLADSGLILLFSVIGASLSVVVAAWHTAEGGLSAGGLLVILFLAGECMKTLTDLNTYWHGSYLGFSIAEQLYAVLDEPIVLIETGNGEAGPMDGNPPAIRFEEVTFRYDENSRPALYKVSMEIAAGEKVAIAGKSGSGKSTVVNLLLRFFDVGEGAVLIGGKDIRNLTPDVLRSQIAVVFQDTYLFYGTLEENLRMAKPDASREELEKAAMAAGAHDFICGLPRGYDTIVGERGATLSGGERQRLSIARAILKNAPILVLDEATSSVDVASERQIQAALENLMESRTTIMIAHRLSTLKNADRIYVLEDGRLCEQGNHQKLLDQDGVYAHLVRIQKKAGSLG